jgi:hypothetical protein
MVRGHPLPLTVFLNNPAASSRANDRARGEQLGAVKRGAIASMHLVFAAYFIGSHRSPRQ